MQAEESDGSYVPNTYFTNMPAAGINGFNAASVALSLFGANSNRFLNLELSALEADGKGKIISSPRVITADQMQVLLPVVDASFLADHSGTLRTMRRRTREEKISSLPIA